MHAQTITVNDMSCLEHTEQSTSVTEIMAQGISQDQLGSKSLSSVANFLYDQSTLLRMTNACIHLPKVVLELS